jgi:hypothetical protein
LTADLILIKGCSSSAGNDVDYNWQSGAMYCCFPIIQERNIDVRKYQFAFDVDLQANMQKVIIYVCIKFVNIELRKVT